MKEVYEFLDDACRVADGFFEFFYEKSISEFKYANINGYDEYAEFRGDGKGLKGREKEFENIFYSYVEKYKGNDLDAKDYIYKVEQSMLMTDYQGRVAIARRLIRKLGELAHIDVYGIDEITGSDYYYSSICLFETIYKGDLERKGDLVGIPDELIKTYECLSFILSIEMSCLCFMDEIKELCRDFEIKYEDEVSSFGFEGLKEITSTEMVSRNRESMRERKGGVLKCNEFTNNRKRIAIEALLGGLNIKRGALGNISSAEMYRFAHLITGKGTKGQKTDNLPTKDMFSNKPKSKEIREKDNHFVAEYFQKLGLNDIAEDIKKGIYD